MSDSIDRRTFIHYGAATGIGLALGDTAHAAPSENPRYRHKGGKIKTRGYAAFDLSGKLHPWEFERRPVGDNDILIDIKYASICHSDIHHLNGDWGERRLPQVPGHEIVGIVSAVGKDVRRFKVGERAGVGCMVDSCMVCESCKSGLEQHCDNGKTLFTYGSPDRREPTGNTQGGYSSHIVVREHFAAHIPDDIPFARAAPLLCAGITAYSPLMKHKIKAGDKVGVAGIGGLGHMAVKLAQAKGTEVYAFTTSPDKADDIKQMGAKAVIVVDDVSRLKAHTARLDYLIATIPVQFDAAAYAATVKPFGHFTIVGLGPGFKLDNVNTIALSQSRVNINVSLIGGMPETQEVIDFCAKNKIFPHTRTINAGQINQAWEDVIAKKARYRYVIDATTF